MTTTRTCKGCKASIADGVPDVFCPACALREALAIGSDLTRGAPYGESWFVRLLRRLHIVKDAGDDLASENSQDERFAPAMPVPVPGDVIEDYEILEHIGGHMGMVFKARHRLLNRVVALKLLPADWMAEPGRLARFHQEMRAMGPLEHPNLVTATDARSVHPWHLVSMEWIEGVDLHRLVKTRGPLSVAEACAAVRQAAVGLQYAHEHNLIHRDIKPSNLMLTRSGTVKVIDMGLALTMNDTTLHLTRTGDVMGTFPYCAPEQLNDSSRVDIRADIYGLGCTLYHLLTGKPPYGHHRSAGEIVQAHLNEPFPSLAKAGPDVPTGLDALLARMTAKDREMRFSTPGEVAAALESFARGAELGSVVPAIMPQIPPRRAAPSKPIQARPVTSSGHSLNTPWRSMAALFLALLVVAGVGVLIKKPELVVVLMDSNADGAIYNPGDKGKGITNAEEIKKFLQEILPRRLLHSEALSSTWKGEEAVIAKRPQLIAIHRSALFHSFNAVFKFGATSEFPKSADDPMWQELYTISDEMLIRLMANLGTEAPQAKFLIYSRGTDRRWLDPDFRLNWVKDIEARFPKLKNRITTMVIWPDSSGLASFKNSTNRTAFISNVVEILRLPRKAAFPPVEK